MLITTEVIKNNDKCILSCAFGFSLVLILISHFCTELATKFQIGISTPWAQGSLKFLLILFLSARPCLLFHLYYLKCIILFSWASIMFSSIFGVMHIPNNSKIWHSCLVLNLTSKNHVSGISRGKKICWNLSKWLIFTLFLKLLLLYLCGPGA